jgi:uncharacterized protein (DUF58 family)
MQARAIAADGIAGGPPIDDAPLSSPHMIERLMRLSLVARRMPQARLRGERRTRRLGSGTETVDTRPYVLGDDPRRIAWSAYARFERLLVRLTNDETPVKLALVIDTSASMSHGSPSKLRQAARIAAGLAAVALAGEDRVAVIAAGNESAPPIRARGRRSLQLVIDALDKLQCGGVTDLARAANRATTAVGGRGLCVLISDFLDPEGPLAGARALRGHGHEVGLVEVLTPFEHAPQDLSGYELEDCETGEIVELPDAGAIQAYRAALLAQQQLLDDGARQLGAALVRTTSDIPFESVVLDALTAGLLRAGGAR